ncbi:MAG: AfsR/SARP family transcriptional regulator [Candidatus Promineifilaceae bacterium]
MHLSLRLLGSFEAQLDSDGAVESRAKRIEALLAFLATESGHAHRRELLVGLLFPDMPEEQARTNLRQTLTRLRRAINDGESDPPFLLVSREATQFNPESDYSLDIEDFEKLLKGCQAHRLERNAACENCNQRLAEAVELYRGPFLENFFLDDSDAFENWVVVKREHYHAQALAALQELADYYERGGDYALATEYARQLVRLEPWKEEAQRQLMRLLAYQGQRTAALQQYHRLETRLRNDLGVEPVAETKALYNRIRDSEDVRPFRLPARNADFVGRERELALLNDYLTDQEKQLVTVTGPGGSGKTAIATEAGWRIAKLYLGPFLDGVFFVPLAGIDSGELAPAPGSSGFDPYVTAIAEAIGFSFSGPRPPHDQLSRYMQDKSLLLIIDNVEHVINDVRPLIADLLYKSPGSEILVTSRERLGLHKEWVMEIEGLPYPGDGDVSLAVERGFPGSEDPLTRYQAIALFESLGKRLVPDFSISSDPRVDCPATAVQRIAQLVQGLPLGIELAASWLRILNCTEIAEEIENSLDFLYSTMHDLPSRHRSLRAVFDSSWQLLNEQEQQALRRLSVFHGSFDRAAATAVTGASLVTLSALVDHSMLHRQDGVKEMQPVGQYVLLEVLRQYAVEKLEEDPDEAASMRERHATHYLDILWQQQDVLIGKDQAEAVTSISQNITEIRYAWRWAVQHQDISSLEHALVPLAQFYYMRSWFNEAFDLFNLASSGLAGLESTPQLDRFLAQLKSRLGWFTFLVGRQQEGRDLLEDSITLLRGSGDALELAYSLSFTAAALAIMGNYKRAKLLAGEALVIYERYQYAYGCAIANNILSQIAYQEGAYLVARQHCEASLAYERAIGNRWSLGFSLANLGRVFYALEDYDEAYKNLQESLVIRQELRDKRGQAMCLRFLGETAQAQGNLNQAQHNLNASLSLFRSIGSQDETAGALNCLGNLAYARQDLSNARYYYADALKIAKEAATMPRILEATISLAVLMVEDEPLLAARIATAVLNHPAASQKSREKAADLIDALKSIKIDGMSDAGSPEDSYADIDIITDELLAAFAQR